MKKITCFLSLFLLMVVTAMAETVKQPSSTLLTVSELEAATEDVQLAIKCISGTNNYWFCGDKSVNSTTDQEIVWVWEPTGDGSTHYLKKFAPTDGQGEGYLQAGTYGIGAKETAQKFKAVTATLPGPSDAPVEGTNTDEGYIVRFAWEDGSQWVNVQTPTGDPRYNTGQGLFTMYNVYAVEDVEVETPPVAEVITSLSQLSNNKAYTLVTQRSQLVVNADGTQLRTAIDESMAFDAANDRFQFAILKNSKDQYYLYSVNASKFVANTGALVETPTDALYFYDNNNGTFTLYFDNTHFINMGGSRQLIIDGWGPGGNGSADEGNSYTITAVTDFEPSAEVQAMLNSVSVTFKYMVGETLYTEAVRTLPVGTVLAEAHFTDLTNDYVTVESWDVTDEITDDAVVTVTCTVEELPFVASESYENATWYLVDMHSTDTGDGDIQNGSKNYLWTATTETEAELVTAAEVTLPKYDAKQTAAFDDNMLWCFVGNVADGFKIYNKAAGSEYALAKPETENSAVKLAAEADATSFRIYKSSAVEDGTCFKKVDDTHYINTQKVGEDKVLRGWHQTDGGSSCRFFAPDYYLLNYAAEVNAAPANALGAAQYFNAEGKFEEFNAVVDAANADHFDATATANLAAFLTDYASNEENAVANDATITDGGYYRLMSVGTKTWLAGNAEGTALASDEAGNGANSVFKFVANGENYNLSVQGAYVGAGEEALVEEADKADLQVSHTGAQFTVGSSEVAAKWYVLPATSVDVPLGITVNEKTYATTYLPFDVTLPEDGTVKAYIVTAAENGMATPAEVADIPSYTGVVLEGQTAEVSVATLTIADATAECDDNLLSGTNFSLPIEEDAMADYYTMSNGTNGVGFYSPNDAALRENNAFLAAAFVTVSDEFEGFLLDLNGQSLPEPPVKEDYALNFDKDANATRSDRYITNISFTAADGEAQTINVNQAKPYVDETATELVCAPGDEIAVEIGFNGFWMHGYVFVDVDNDGQFSFNEGSTDQSGTDVMSFSFYSGDFNNDTAGANSAGTELTGDARNTMFTPSFTAPEAAGTYRIRFKLDWNSVDPGGQLAADGTPTGANGILSNGGMIVDATLNVTDRTGIGAVEAASASAPKGIYDLSGRRLQKAPAHGVYIQDGKKIVK